MITEANEFVWPGPDLRPVPGRDTSTYFWRARTDYSRFALTLRVALRAIAIAAARRCRRTGLLSVGGSNCVV
jgi:hypothetical protein